jgi:hypothetical protein
MVFGIVCFFYFTHDLPSIETLKNYKPSAITKIFSGALSDYLGKRKLLAGIGYGLAAVTKPIFPLANTIPRPYVQNILRRYPTGVTVIEGETYDAIAASDAAVVTSGTATLETALMGTPMVIIYKLSSLTYWIGRALVHVKHIGLVNLVAGKTIAP